MFELRPFERRNNHVAAYDPWDQMERAFFGDGSWGRGLSEFKTDIQDKGDSYLLEADLPGFKKEDIHVDVDGDTMTIRAERHSEHEDQDKKGNYVRCERSYGSYQRAFDISGVEVANISAQYNDGAMTPFGVSVKDIFMVPEEFELPNVSLATYVKMNRGSILTSRRKYWTVA